MVYVSGALSNNAKMIVLRIFDNLEKSRLNHRVLWETLDSFICAAQISHFFWTEKLINLVLVYSDWLKIDRQSAQIVPNKNIGNFLGEKYFSPFWILIVILIHQNVLFHVLFFLIEITITMRFENEDKQIWIHSLPMTEQYDVVALLVLKFRLGPHSSLDLFQSGDTNFVAVKYASHEKVHMLSLRLFLDEFAWALLDAEIWTMLTDVRHPVFDNLVLLLLSQHDFSQRIITLEFASNGWDRIFLVSGEYNHIIVAAYEQKNVLQLFADLNVD